MPDMSNNEYLCAMCGGTFEAEWSDEEAWAEHDRNFPGKSHDTAVQVCDDCYKAIYTEATLMTDKQYRRFLDLLMCSDPWPVADLGDGDGEDILICFANAEARRRGYDSWVVAFHELEVA